MNLPLCSWEQLGSAFSRLFRTGREGHFLGGFYLNAKVVIKRRPKASAELMKEWFSQELLQMAAAPETTAGIVQTPSVKKTIPQPNKLGPVFPGLWIIFLVSKGCFLLIIFHFSELFFFFNLTQIKCCIPLWNFQSSSTLNGKACALRYELLRKKKTCQNPRFSLGARFE